MRYAIKNEQDFAVSTIVTITVLPVADAPVARDDALVMSEDLPLTLFASQLLANDTDADRQAIMLTRIVETSGVTITDLGFGQLQITPDGNVNGPAWFDYEIEDSTGRSAVARVNISISAVNDAPSIDAIPVLKGTEDQPFSFTLPAGFASDIDGDAILVEVRGQGGAALPAWLNYDRETRTLSGQPPVNVNGVVALEIAASDGMAQTVRELLVSIAPVNDAPEAIHTLRDQEARQGDPLAFDLDGTAFSDLDGDVLTFSATLGDGAVLPSWLSFDGVEFTGTPPGNYSGNLDIRVTASDGSLTANSIFRLTIPGGNATPVIVQPLPDVESAEDAAIAFAIPAGSFSDADGDALTYTATLGDGTALPSWLIFDGAQFTGAPPANYSGVMDIRVTASDGLLTASDTFRLTIVPVNDAPVVVTPLADVASPRGVPVSIAIPDSMFADIDNASLTRSLSLANGEALPAWLSFDGARLVGTPPSTFSGALDIMVAASDGALTAHDVFRLTIHAVNNAPVVRTLLPDVSSPEDRAVTFAIPAGSFADSDGDALIHTARLANGSALPAWLSFDGSQFTGVPPANYNGILDIRVTASDGARAVSDVFRLTITPENDGPVLTTPLTDVVAAEDTFVSVTIPTGSFTDIDNTRLTYTARLADGSALPAWLSVSGNRILGRPPVNFTGVLDIEVTASDGALTASDGFRLTVTPVNDAPVRGILLPDVSSPEDTSLSIAIPAGSFTDIDGDALTLTAQLVTGLPLPSWLTFDGAQFTGTPPANFTGVVDIRVTASDGVLSTSDAFRLTITPVNDGPVLAMSLPDMAVPEDFAISFVIPAGRFTDPDNVTLTYSARLSDGSPLPSWLVLNGSRFQGRPPLNFNGDLDITVTASDGSLTAADTFRLSVTPVNDAPVRAVLLPDVSLPKETPFAFSPPAGSFTDADGDDLTLTAQLSTGLPLPEWLTFDGATFTGMPPANYTGAIDIRITASDNSMTANDIFRLSFNAPPPAMAALSAPMPSADGADTANVLALMRQDMAAFGSASGEGLLTPMGGDQNRPIDYYA